MYGRKFRASVFIKGDISPEKLKRLIPFNFDGDIFITGSIVDNGDGFGKYIYIRTGLGKIWVGGDIYTNCTLRFDAHLFVNGTIDVLNLSATGKISCKSFRLRDENVSMLQYM